MTEGRESCVGAWLELGILDWLNVLILDWKILIGSYRNEESFFIFPPLGTVSSESTLRPSGTFLIVSLAI